MVNTHVCIFKSMLGVLEWFLLFPQIYENAQKDKPGIHVMQFNEQYCAIVGHALCSWLILKLYYYPNKLMLPGLYSLIPVIITKH